MLEVVAENYLCLYALLEMVLRDVGNNEFNQYSLADYFGITVPMDFSSDKITNIKHSTEEREWGASLNIQNVNQFFNMNKISLKAKYLTANPFNEYEEAETMSDGKYIIYLYSYGHLNHEPVNYDVGHASLLMNYGSNRAKIYDPGPRNAGIKEISVSNLYDAIYDSRGGILIIEKE